MHFIEQELEQVLTRLGIESEIAIYLRLLSLVLLLSVVALTAFWITKRIVIIYIYKIIRKSPVTWDDVFADQQVFNNVAHAVPALIIRSFSQFIFRDFDFILPNLIKVTDAYLILVFMTILISVFKVLEFALSRQPAFQDKPISSYFQLVRIVIYIGSGILVLSVILGESPLYFLSAFGAMTAIVLLIFKDTILGLVASVQMSSNDMVRVGDWVEMPKFNADGDVIAINLNTVKIQNWDRTITTIPTYYFITDSFKNWRGMVESGGRRIKRALYINSNSVQFVSAEMREQYKQYQLIAEYVIQRQSEIEQHNQQHNIDTSILINGRRMTNIGVFRKYVEMYLRNHPLVHQQMTILVRQMAMEDSGIPIEIYCFTRTTAWSEYEAIQADIFDHLLAAVEYFGLDVFQKPAGNDIVEAVKQLNVRRE
jgi:miniconductance mechanosensitive channel